MDDTFDGFSEAARLYAKNAQLVAQMHGAMRADIDRFLKALTGKLTEDLQPLQLQTRTTLGYCYWWLADDDTVKDDHAQLCAKTDNAALVVPGTLQLYAYAPKATQVALERLAALARSSAFSDICISGKGGPWSLFTASIAHGGSDPIAATAPRVAALLSAMHDVYPGG